MVALTVAVTACDKPVPDKGDEMIRFGVDGLKAEVLTKAYSENTLSSVESAGFNIAGLVGSTAMFNDHASLSSSFWYPDSGPYYYPSSGTMDFYGVFPVSQSISLSGSAATLDYTQNADTDLLVARSHDVSASESAVALTFDHALSLVRFNAVGSDPKALYKVKTIKITTPTSGTYNYGANFAAETWTPGGETAQLTYSSTVTTLDGTTAIAGGMTVIPCTPTIYVEWDTYTLDGTSLVASYSDSKALGSALAKGVESTITLTLPNADAVPIFFSVAVNPWGSASLSLDFSEE